MKNLAVIGCGLRADCYMHQLASGLGKEWQISALADTDPAAIEVYIKHYGSPEVRTFSSGPELLKEMKGKLDAVIIASPNRAHVESLVPAIEQRLTILAEKPVATSAADCSLIWKAYVRENHPPLAVGFVLRYTSFYGKIKEIIDSGAIGEVMVIQATENLGPMLTQCYGRGWRRHDSIAGSFILEKCCHDMDILAWLTASRARKVSSFAQQSRFAPDPDAAMHCEECKLKSSCRYDVDKLRKHVMDAVTPGRHETLSDIFALNMGRNDLCVFNSEKDVPDRQVMNIEYENGILATFTAVMEQPETTRTISVHGSAGQIVGNIGRDELHVHRLSEDDYVGYTPEQVPLGHDDSGHHGADSIIGEQFKAMLRGSDQRPQAGLREGIEGCLVAFAAEQSRHEGKVVVMSEMRDKVMPAGGDGT